MSEAISAVDADFARVSAASLQLAAAMAQENSGPTAKPGDVERGHAAVQAAEANLEQAEAALQADQSAAAVSNIPTTSTTTPAAPAAPAVSAPSSSQHVTDPGGIVA